MNFIENPKRNNMSQATVRRVHSWVDNQSLEFQGEGIPVLNPSTGQAIAHVQNSTSEQIAKGLESSQAAFVTWSAKSWRERVFVLRKCFDALTLHTPELIQLITVEHGKTLAEAAGDVSKGLETFEYALSLPLLLNGNTLPVSTGVTCVDSRQPVGVFASIVPFNFPFMVPFWTLPIALATGNVVILKPSEKVPLTMTRVAEILCSSGLPDGVLNLLHGTGPVVQALLASPIVVGVTFVGSTPIARLVYSTACQQGKRAICLGGAKNHLIAMKDCDLEMTSTDILSSFAGCSGQRCMAASVLLLVGEQTDLLRMLVEKASKVTPGSQSGQMGPVIDQASLAKITGYIQGSIDKGAQVLLDGRNWSDSKEQGYWIGPTILLIQDRVNDASMRDEIFGPVLSIYTCRDVHEAIEIENTNPFGNAACIYTSNGGTAEWFTRRFKAGMLGVNIGVPVPREPFSFGGIQQSKFGHGDITGDGAIEFFTNRIKVTTKWARGDPKNWMG